MERAIRVVYSTRDKADSVFLVVQLPFCLFPIDFRQIDSQPAVSGSYLDGTSHDESPRHRGNGGGVSTLIQRIGFHGLKS